MTKPRPIVSNYASYGGNLARVETTVGREVTTSKATVIRSECNHETNEMVRLLVIDGSEDYVIFATDKYGEIYSGSGEVLHGYDKAFDRYIRMIRNDRRK